MLKRYLLPFLYYGFFPLFILIGFTLLVLPQFSSFIVDEATFLALLIRILMTLWVILSYVVIGISFIPNSESSQVASFSHLGRYDRFLDENQQPRFTRGIFSVIYVFLALVSCVFTSKVLLLVISTVAKPSASLTLIIAIVNFALLFLPHVVFYNRALKVLYGDESF